MIITKNNEQYLKICLALLLFLTLLTLGILVDPLFVKICLLLLMFLILCFFFKGDTLLFSLLVIAYMLGSSHITATIHWFKWSGIYYLLAVLIILANVHVTIKRRRLGNIFSDKYLYMSLLILCWGILTAIPSLQQAQSIKNITSAFIVFFVFYFIPRYFYTFAKQMAHFKALVVSANVTMTTICLINILSLSSLVNVRSFFQLWSPSESIYLNPNTFGAKIMFTLMLMNVLFVINGEFKDRSMNKPFQIYMAASYLILVVNLFISSSRAAILGVAIALIPFCFKYIKKALALIPLLAILFYYNLDSLLFLKKFQSINALSGRLRIWRYVLDEVIAKHPFAGIGSGASQDYLGTVFGGLSAHNSYLNVTMSLGFIGLLLWFVVLILLFQKAFLLSYGKYVYLAVLFGFMAYAFFEVSLFGGMGLGMSIFWSIVLMVEIAGQEKKSVALNSTLNEQGSL